MKKFTGTDFLSFSDYFSSDEKCKKYLTDLKWAEGYECRRCTHNKFIDRKDHRRMCQKCKMTESSTSGTLLHGIGFGLRKAFMIMFEMTTSSKGISALQISKRYSISYNTALNFTHKIRGSMQSSNKYPLTGIVEIDEFVIGSKEKGKPGRSTETKKSKVVTGVELSEKKGIKRVYFQIIQDYSAESLQVFFDEKISVDAQVVTDKWKGYIPLKEKYSIEQKLSSEGSSFPELHIIIHQVKSWIRTIFSGVSKKYIQNYLNEFAFRLNRSIYKETIFHKLIERVVEFDINDKKILSVS